MKYAQATPVYKGPQQTTTARVALHVLEGWWTWPLRSRLPIWITAPVAICASRTCDWAWNMIVLTHARAGLKTLQPRNYKETELVLCS